MKSIITVENLVQQYGRRTVLDRVSLTLAPGQTLALLGRNGAGKTTLIRTLMGLLSPVSGSVRVFEIDPLQRPLEVRRCVGYLAEDQAMYGWMTPAELGRFLAPFYPTWDMAFFHELLSRFDVQDRQRIKHLSKGQNVRLGLSLALAHRPKLVVLDDPALGLDPIARKQFNRDLVQYLQAEGHAVLYSSHLLSEVEAVADAVAIIDGGRIVRIGSTEDVQRDVKRILIPSSAAIQRGRPAALLDVRRDGRQLAATVDHAGDWIAELRAEGIDPIVEDLSLDEIFEAFVIGRCDDWPDLLAKPVAALA